MLVRKRTMIHTYNICCIFENINNILLDLYFQNILAKFEKYLLLLLSDPKLCSRRYEDTGLISIAYS